MSSKHWGIKLTRAHICCWALLVLGWWTAINWPATSRFLGLVYCPGPVPSASPRREPWCVAFKKVLDKEVERLEYDKVGAQLVFYGDSITETWRGTDQGRACRRCAGAPAVFARHFGAKYSTVVLAVGGDQTAHLLWRLKHGETFIRNQPNAAVILIGTNDLGAAACFPFPTLAIKQAANGTAARMEAIVRHLRWRNPATHLLLVAALPRGWTDPLHVFSLPSMYTPGIAALNLALQRLALADSGYVHYVDCGSVLTPFGQLEPTLMPDALHPNAAGMELFATCLQPFVDNVMGLQSAVERAGAAAARPAARIELQ